jgi:hypothetical protein
VLNGKLQKTFAEGIQWDYVAQILFIFKLLRQWDLGRDIDYPD